MRTLSVNMSKGGTGKTTIAATLAAELFRRGERVALLDLDGGQGSLTLWWTLRGEPENPQLVEINAKIKPLVKRLAGEGVAWLIIDGPPLDMELMDAAVMAADAVLIPVRASFQEVAAVGATVETCRARRKPFAFVLNAVDPKFPKPLARAVYALEELGPVLGARMSYRQAYFIAPENGSSAAEVDKTLAAEAAALCDATIALVEGGRG